VASKPEEVDPAALAAALADLYAVAPEEFVATRTSLVQEAKARGDAALARELGRARRPTVAAWAVNAVVREHPEKAEHLHDLGRRMRAAHAQLDAGALTELRKERDLLLGGWADAADEVGRRAGRPLTTAVGDEVRATLIAALAGEEATQAVVSGHLTRGLSYSGFGDVDLSEAVVRTSSGAVLSVVESARPAPGKAAKKSGSKQEPAKEEPAERAAPKKEAGQEQRPEKPAREEQARQRRVAAARRAHDDAREAAEEAARAVDQARDRADESRWRVEELEAQLKQARGEHRDAEQAATAAARARRTAQVEVAKAERALREAETGRP
jgi:hypothetical protein